MARSMKYCVAICLFICLFQHSYAQISNDSLDALLYEFEAAVIQNDSEIVQSLGKKLALKKTEVKEINRQVLLINSEIKLNLHLDDLDKAREIIENAEKICRSNSEEINSNTLSQLYYTKSLFANLKGDVELEESCLDSCVTILKTEGNINHQLLASAYQNLCYIYYGKSQVLKSIDLLRMAEAEMKEINTMNQIDSLLIGNIFNDIAYLCGSVGNNDEVIPYYRLAIDYNPTAHNIKISLANNLRYEGDHKTANVIVQSVLDETSDSRPDIKASALTAMNTIIGTSENYLYDNPEEEMIRYYNEIIEYQKELPKTFYPYDAAAAGVLSDYFRRVVKERDLKKATFYLGEQKRLLEEKAELYDNASVFYLRTNHKSRSAQLDWMQKDFESSEARFQDLIAFYTGIEEASDEAILNIVYQKEQLKHILIDYTRMLLNQGTYSGNDLEYFEKADAKYLLVDTAIDSLLSFNEAKIDEEATAALQRVGFGIALKQYESTQDKKFLTKAYQRFEKLSTLSSYRHHLQSTMRYSNEKETELKKHKNLLREEMDILEGVVSEDEKEQARINQSLDSLNNIFIGVSEQLSSATNSYNDQTEKNKLASLDQLQNSMSFDDVFFHVVLDNIAEEVYILLVSKDQVESKTFYINDLQYKIDQVLKSLSNPESNDYKDQLKALYADFISPFELLIQNKKLIFIPGQYVASLPFGLLMDDQEEYLCFKNPILYKYSSSWKPKENHDLVRGKKFVAYATKSNIDGINSGSNSGSQFASAEGLNTSDGNVRTAIGTEFLSAALKEVNLLKDKYGADLFYNEENPKQTFIEKSQQANLLHVAVHSNVEPLNPIKSSLMLTADNSKEGQLYYHEIDDMQLTADLVLLSSCQSGLSYPKNAGSVSSLARAFQLAGAKNLIQTTWSINDESTSDLMKIFYKKLEEGEEISKTLARAKKEFVLQAPSKWQHPYYWGAFVLNGEDGVVNIPKATFSRSSVFGVTGIMSLLLLFIFAKYRYKQT